jgi:hypothetical protein
MKESQKVMERCLIATVRSSGQEHHVAFGVFGQTTQNSKPLVLRLRTCAHRGMRLLDDDELWAGSQELGATTIRLDVVERDHSEGIDIEYRLPLRQPAFEPTSSASPNNLALEPELRGEFLLPLIAEMRWAEDGNATDLASVKQFAGDEASFNRFADAHIVRDEQPNRLHLERHEERHKLIRTGLHRDVSERPEGSSASTELEAKRISQQQRGSLRPGLLRVRRREGCRAWRDRFEWKVDEGRIFLRATERTKA